MKWNRKNGWMGVIELNELRAEERRAGQRRKSMEIPKKKKIGIIKLFNKYFKVSR